MTKPRRPLTPDARQRQQDGQYKGLLHAAQKRKADNSANYATNFKHGQMACDFERSAEAAGESRDELRSHFALLDRTLLKLCGWFRRAAAALPGVRGQTPDSTRKGTAEQGSLPLHTDAASPRAPKLVRALGMLLWRPFRLYRNQENWERLAICWLLQKIKGWRQHHGELTAERADKFHWELVALLDNYNRRIDPATVAQSRDRPGHGIAPRRAEPHPRAGPPSLCENQGL